MLIISVNCVTSTSIIQRRPPEEKDEESIDSDSDDDFQPRPKRTKQEHGLSAADSATPGTVLLEARVSAGSRMQLFDVSKKPSEYLFCLIPNAILFIFVVMFPVNN